MGWVTAGKNFAESPNEVNPNTEEEKIAV